MILPLVVASIAVLVTLAYASILDVRERSVPVHTWYPLYLVGSVAVLWYLITAPSGWGTVAGYAALIVTIIYGIELEVEDGKIPGRSSPSPLLRPFSRDLHGAFSGGISGFIAIAGFIVSWVRSGQAWNLRGGRA